MKYEKSNLKQLTVIRTGKLDSNAAVSNGMYPFFTCDPTTLRINTWAYDTEAVLLAGNNASGNYTAKYYKGQFNAYQRTYIIESADKEKLDVRYLAYAMNKELKLLKTMSAGSTTKFLKIGMLHSLEISLPDISIQRKIASILGNYDNLIENNQKQIKLLEEAAQRLYKEWFVDLHFPGYEDAKLVNGVPEGWEITPINMVAKIKAGGDKPKNFSEKMTNENKIPVFANGITEKGLMGFTDKAVISNPSVTISARGTVGVVFLRIEPYVPIVRLISVTPIKDKMDVFYLYLYLVNQNFRSTGAAQQQITVPLLKSKNIICPSDNLRESFNGVITPIFNKIEILENHVNKLTEVRDCLLPKLISGEIEV